MKRIIDYLIGRGFRLEQSYEINDYDEKIERIKFQTNYRTIVVDKMDQVYFVFVNREGKLSTTKAEAVIDFIERILTYENDKRRNKVNF